VDIDIRLSAGGAVGRRLGAGQLLLYRSKIRTRRCPRIVGRIDSRNSLIPLCLTFKEFRPTPSLRTFGNSPCPSYKAPCYGGSSRS